MASIGSLPASLPVNASVKAGGTRPVQGVVLGQLRQAPAAEGAPGAGHAARVTGRVVRAGQAEGRRAAVHHGHGGQLAIDQGVVPGLGEPVLVVRELRCHIARFVRHRLRVELEERARVVPELRSRTQLHMRRAAPGGAAGPRSGRDGGSGPSGSRGSRAWRRRRGSLARRAPRRRRSWRRCPPGAPPPSAGSANRRRGRAVRAVRRRWRSPGRARGCRRRCPPGPCR